MGCAPVWTSRSVSQHSQWFPGLYISAAGAVLITESTALYTLSKHWTTEPSAPAETLF